MKKVGKILGCAMLWLAVLLYVAVALVNYSGVQTLVGSMLSAKVSEKCGATMRVGSIGVNVLSGVKLRNVLMVTPEGDTVANGEEIDVRFREMPYKDGRLHFSRVDVKNTYYCFANDSIGSNLSFLSRLFEKDTTQVSEKGGRFVVEVDELRLKDVHFRMNNERSGNQRRWAEGVDIPHMEFLNIEGRLKNVRVDRDHVTCKIEGLSTQEKSGFVVDGLWMDVYVSNHGISVTDMEVKTEGTRLMCDVLLDYGQWKTMSSYVDSVYMLVRFKPGCVGCMKDAAYWAPTLWGMDERVGLEGLVYGPVADLHAEGMNVTFGEASQLLFDGFIYGLPNMDTTVIGGDVHRLRTSYSDLASVKHPGDRKMRAEGIVKTLDELDLSASFIGTIHDFYATTNVRTTKGTVDGELLLRYDENAKDFSYVGSASSSSFVVSALFPNEWVSRTGFRVEAQGSGFDPKRMACVIEGKLFGTSLRGNSIEGASFMAEAEKGLVSLTAGVDDPLLDLGIEGVIDMRDSLVRYRGEADVRNVDLAALGMWNGEDTSALLGAKARVEASGNSLDDLCGGIVVEDARLVRPEGTFRLNRTEAEVRSYHSHKDIELVCDLFKIEMSGYFDYGDFPMLAKKFVSDYVPQYWSGSQDLALDYGEIADVSVDLDMEWLDSLNQLGSVLPKLEISLGTVLQGHYNYAESLKLALRSDRIALGGMELHDVMVTTRSLGSRYLAVVTASTVGLNDQPLVEDFKLRTSTNREMVNCSLLWDDRNTNPTKGDVSVVMTSRPDTNIFSVRSNGVEVHGEEWTIGASGPIQQIRMSLASEQGEAKEGEKKNDINRKHEGIGDAFVVRGLSVSSEGHSIVANLDRRRTPSDNLELTFDGFDIGRVDFLLEPAGFDVEGFVDGRFSMFGFDEIPYFTANLKVGDWVVNGQPLGDADISSSWNAEYNQLNLYLNTELNKEGGVSTPLMASGYVALGDEKSRMKTEDGSSDSGSEDGSFIGTEDVPARTDGPEEWNDGEDFLESAQLHFDVSFDGFSMQTLAPLMESFSSQFEGALGGDFEVRGSLKSPEVEGVAYIDDGLVKVDFLNTIYRFSDSITLSNNEVSMRHFTLHDDRGNVALVDGVIRHHNFSDFLLDISLTTDNFLFMNTTAQDNAYYGTVLASAEGKVTGPFNDIDISVRATTREGSALYVPINNRRQVKDLDYIQFVSEDYYNEDEVSQDSRKKQSENRYRLTIALDVTPDVRVNIPMDFNQMYVDIGARGNGDLQLGISSESDFSILGDYEIGSGTMALKLLSVLNKGFAIEEGSTIKFTGSIPDAIFDIRAIYSQRVNMASLTGTVSTTEHVQSNVQVENVIALTGTLESPTLGFDIRLPNADQSLEDEVFAYIDRTNERDMLNQTVSLLLLGQFYSMSTSANNGSFLDNGLSSGYSVVANSVGSVVSNMVQVVDINFGYKAATDLTTEHYEVDINKEWNKFYLESSFGIGGDSRELSDVDNDNNLVGDMLLGYKLSPRFHIFVFNRSNTNDYTRSDLPYKQGFGLKYTRDFDSWKEIFPKAKKTSGIKN